MSRWRLIAFGLAAYALGLIATAPATLFDAQLQQAAGGLRLVEASGTLWAGAGQIEVRDASRHSGIATRVRWRMRPAYLLRGELRYEVTLGEALKPFPVAISGSRLEVTNANVNLPAAALSMAMPRLQPLGLTGDVFLHITRLAFERGAIQGNATLQWRAAGSAYAPITPLGDYELRLQGDGATVRASLRTLQGPLQLDGQGIWSAGRKPVLRATARIPPQHRQQLAPLLRLIAVEQSDGSFIMR